MLYEEYKEIFEEILKLSEELEVMLKKKQVDDIGEVFDKRDALFKKLSTPSDIDEEKIKYIYKLRDKIKEKNDFILRAMQVAKNEIKQALLDTIQEEKVIEAYKVPKGDISSSIFDSRE